MSDAVEILERALAEMERAIDEDAQCCMFALQPIREALAALRGPEPEIEAFVAKFWSGDSHTADAMRRTCVEILKQWEQRPRGEQG